MGIIIFKECVFTSGNNVISELYVVATTLPSPYMLPRMGGFNFVIYQYGQEVQ
jgi:hypothetical protein